MKKITAISCLVLILFSCRRERVSSLETDLESSNTTLSDQYIIACAAGMPNGFMGEMDYPVSMFFYPVQGALNYRYYETSTDNVNEWDYKQYKEVLSTSIPVFNGYLRRFQLPENKNRWGIVTYEVNDSVRICDPVYIKVNTQATEWAPQKMNVAESGINPSFTWEEFPQFDNAIHFNVVADTLGNLISGTYTNDTNWTFYDLSNVTLNIRDVNPAPSLDPSSKYQFTLMSVSEDNWVTTFGQIEFRTF